MHDSSMTINRQQTVQECDIIVVEKSKNASDYVQLATQLFTYKNNRNGVFATYARSNDKVVTYEMLKSGTFFSSEHTHGTSHLFICDELIYAVMDQIGLDPIYRYEDATLLIYSISMQRIVDLIKSMGITLALNEEYVAYYLYAKVDYITCPDYSTTIFKKITKMAGGEAQTYRISDNHTNFKRYGLLNEDYKNHKRYPISLAVFLDQASYLLRNNIKNTPQKIAVSLSSGIDSNYLLSLLKQENKEIYALSNVYKNDTLADESKLIREIVEMAQIESFFFDCSDHSMIDISLPNVYHQPFQGWYGTAFYRFAEKLQEIKVDNIVYGFGPDELCSMSFPQYKNTYFQHPFMQKTFINDFKIKQFIKQKIMRQNEQCFLPVELRSLMSVNLIENAIWLSSVYGRYGSNVCLPYYSVPFIQLLLQYDWRALKEESKYAHKTKWLFYSMAHMCDGFEKILKKPITNGEITDQFALDVMDRQKGFIQECFENSRLVELKIVDRKKLHVFLTACFYDYNRFVYSYEGIRREYDSIFYRWITMEHFLKSVQLSL